jgi:hypothetical protein
MNKDNSLISTELEYKTPDEYKIYDPTYTPTDLSQSIDNQHIIHKKHFYIECYGC